MKSKPEYNNQRRFSLPTNKTEIEMRFIPAGSDRSVGNDCRCILLDKMDDLVEYKTWREYNIEIGGHFLCKCEDERAVLAQTVLSIQFKRHRDVRKSR